MTSRASEVANWLREQEDRFRYVVSECDSTPSIWTDLCLRQADLVLLVASAEGMPSRSEVAQRLFEADAVARSATKELVLLHAPTTQHPSGTARWLAAYPVSRHHRIRMDRSEDYARLAKNAQSGYQETSNSHVLESNLAPGMFNKYPIQAFSLRTSGV